MDYLIKYAKYAANLIFWTVSLVLAVLFGPRLIILFLPFLLGWLLALISDPLVSRLEKNFGIHRKISSALIVLLSVVVILLALYLGAAKIVKESADLVAQLPSIYTSISSELRTAGNNLIRTFDTMPEEVKTYLLQTVNKASGFITDWLEGAAQSVIDAVSGIAKMLPAILIAVLITIMSSYFIIADKEKIKRALDRMLPGELKRKLKSVSKGGNRIVSGYFKAQLIILGIICGILFAGFMLLGIKYALLFSVLIALLDFLPFFGTGTALGPWALFQLLNGNYKMAAGLVIIYIVSQVARRMIEPKILGETIGMSPLLTMVLMYVGFRLIGVWGLILAAPTGMLIMNLDKQGLFDNMKFILGDITQDLRRLRNIDRYTKAAAKNKNETP